MIGQEKDDLIDTRGFLIKSTSDTLEEHILYRDSLPIPDNYTPEEFKDALIKAYDSYTEDVPYRVLPRPGRGNSNSLTGSIIREVGSDYEPVNRLRAPGWYIDVLP